MPEMSGIDLIKKLRACDGIWPLIPIVVLSTSNSKKDIVESYRAGANAYLLKTLKFEKLKADFSSLLNFFGKTSLHPEAD